MRTLTHGTRVRRRCRGRRGKLLILGIGRSTVETHRTALMKKLNLRNTADIICYAYTAGLISDR